MSYNEETHSTCERCNETNETVVAVRIQDVPCTVCVSCLRVWHLDFIGTPEAKEDCELQAKLQYYNYSKESMSQVTVSDYVNLCERHRLVVGRIYQLVNDFLRSV